MTFVIWELRTAQHLSLRQLEEKSGISKTHINDIENGKVNPSVEVVMQLAAALKVDPAELFKV